MNNRRGTTRVAIALVMLAAPLAVEATPIAYDLSFQTSGQSIWNSGTSFTLDKTTFLGVAWQDKKIDIDAMVGQEINPVPNPLRLAYDAAFAVCNALHSASACINGQTAQAPVAALGSRPGVRSCGAFAFDCEFARAGDLISRAAYDTAFAACRIGFSATVCRKGQPLKLPLVALGTAPPSFLNVDTRTGFALNGTTDGRVGLDLGVKIDSGSVDATVSYQATLDIPDTATLDKATPINFNPNSVFAGTNVLNTSFSNVAVSVDAVMELSGSVAVEGCLIGPGCASASAPFNIDETAPILSFNADGEGGILLLGHTPTVFGLPAEANGFPFGLDVAGLAEVTLHLPQPNASGDLDAASQTLKATGQDDLVDLTLDVDNIVASAAGVPGLFGSSFQLPILGSVGFDIINVEMGPAIDLKQEFELDPTLFVSLLFDKAVKVGDTIVTELVAAWDSLPSITFLDDVTLVTPTFFVQADLLNRTLLDFDLEFGIDLLQIFYDFGTLGKDSIGIGNVLNTGVDLFESPDLYSNLFDLAGFNLQIGDPFEVNFQSGSTGPSSRLARSAINEIVLPAGVAAIPEPGTIMLLLGGIFGIHAFRRRAQRGCGTQMLASGPVPNAAPA
ncbi:MAG: PEP-CTERM sorting domain-containing protein [Betaproteobacteria bacterium]|nr:PEP-CTERM sorting domain-containing protein [Betaproteobacteria bacterium]